MSTDKESAPAQNETIKTKIEDAQTLKHGTQTSSVNSPPPEINRSETDDLKALKHDPESDPSAKNDIPQSETQTSSKDSPPSQTNKPETDDSEALKHDPESDHSAKSIPKAETETSSKNSLPRKDGLSQTTPISKDSATDADPQFQPAKSESTSKPSSSTPVQEISPADDETTAEESSRLQNDSTLTVDPGETAKQASVGDAVPSAKKCSNWEILRRIWRKRSKPKSLNSIQDSKDEAAATGPDEKKLQISLIQADLDYVSKRAKELGRFNKQLSSVIEAASTDFNELKTKGKAEDLQELRKDMMKLKLQDPSKYKLDADEKEPLKNLRFRSKAKQGISQDVLSKIPLLHNSNAFETSMEFKDFEARFAKLSLKLKLCLLCFSVFPENAIIRKRLMVQWWVAEGFASEDDAINCFNQLIKKGFIEHVNENRSLSPRSCQLHPFYRSALVMLAEKAKFFNFSGKGEPTQNFSETFQSCLVGEGLISLEDLIEELKEKKEKDLKQKKFTVDLEKLHLLINVDEHILEFKPEWFGRMTNLNFLYLGRWRVEGRDHIEVEDTKFLEEKLENLSCVKFLSLQGISNIIALPKSILKLSNLNILDLRACYNLETIPERVEFLKNLTHLDMSECYLVEYMPKSLSLLRKLKVIKGFVVGADDEGKKIPCCTLNDLKNLPNLVKLCIYTGSVEFPKDRHVVALQELEKLRKLTITWGGSALRTTSDNQPDSGNKKDSSRAENATQMKQESRGKQPYNGNKKDSSRAENGAQKSHEPLGRLPPKLEKLDLQCFPMPKTPHWLELKNLKDLDLKKLYIRGGKLSDFGQYQDTDDCNLVEPVKKETWKVEVLRLKYLSEIQMEWKQLLELFPDLVYLEQVSCPKLTLFPCDANGVWINKIKIKGT